MRPDAGGPRDGWRSPRPLDAAAKLAATQGRSDFPPMLRHPVPLALAAVALAALSLSGCGGGPSQAAAESATRLLAAVMANDRPAFEAEIDRSAVRQDVRRQVTELARETALDVEGGPSDFALDRMISPDAFVLVNSAGQALAAAPTSAQVMALMEVLDDKHVCLRSAEAPTRCLLTFGKDRNGWRLVGMQAMNLRIEVSDAPARPAA